MQRAREKEEAREARNATAVAQSSVAEEEDDDVVDPVITDRMLSRVFTFAGLPVLFGLALYPLFWYLKVCAARLAVRVLPPPRGDGLWVNHRRAGHMFAVPAHTSLLLLQAPCIAHGAH